MENLETQTRPMAHWTTRKPLLFGLVAAGGAGLYAVVQMAGQMQSDEGAGDAADLPTQKAAEPVPAPDFGPVAAAAAESRAGMKPGPATNTVRINLARLKPASAPSGIAAVKHLTGRPHQMGRPQHFSIPSDGLAQLIGKRRYSGSFAVPASITPDLAAMPGLVQQQANVMSAASLAAIQPAQQTAGMVQNVADVQVAQRSTSSVVQPSFAGFAVAPPEAAQQLAAPYPALPNLQPGLQTLPVAAGAADAEPRAALPIINAADSLNTAADASRLVAPQTQSPQPGPAARVSVVKPAEPAATALALPQPSGKTGIEGLAGLDDSRLSEVRPILGESRQPAASAKRRDSRGAARPNARSHADETPANPDKVSAVGTGLDMHVPARINDGLIGSLPLQIAADSTVSVRLGDLLKLVGGQMDNQLFKELQRSPATNSYVDLAMLRAAGMQLRYMPASNQIVLQALTA